MDLFHSFQNGALSALPYIGRFTFAQISSFIADALLSRPNLIHRKTVRRLSFAIAFLFPGFGMILMGYLTQDWVLCVAVMSFCKYSRLLKICNKYSSCIRKERKLPN